MGEIYSMDGLKSIDSTKATKKNEEFRNFVDRKMKKLSGLVHSDWLQTTNYLNGEWTRQISTFGKKYRDKGDRIWHEKNDDLVVPFLQSVGYNFDKK
jgi:hypothetical protein